MNQALPVLEMLTSDDERRFWSHVNRPQHGDEDMQCWPWKGALDKGYGRLTVMGRKLKAHRIAWALHHGEDPPAGLVIDHACGNRSCVNPHHLEAIHQAENMSRAYRYRECKRGHKATSRNARSLCRECYRLRARRISAAAKTLGITQTEFVKRYGYREDTLTRILLTTQSDL